MVKVFDYTVPKIGWVSFPDYDSAKEFVELKFDEYYLLDRDNHHDYIIEIFYDDKYEVWIGEFGSWSIGFLDEDFSADCNIYYGSREDLKNYKFTTLNPRVDYILL